jgi:anti-anti-sigma factor
LLRREDAANAAVLVVEGAIDMATAPRFKKALESIPPDRNVVVDLCDTYFMDSTGLRVLLYAVRSSTAEVRVACRPEGAIRRLFELSLAAVPLRVYDSRADALARR